MGSHISKVLGDMKIRASKDLDIKRNGKVRG